MSEAQARAQRLQRRRRLTQSAFFGLFLAAPSLDLLRFDLTQTQLWFLGQRWTLGIDALVQGQVDANTAALHIITRAFLPALLIVGVFLGIAYRYGRLYCGWLCPHFSVVETLNAVLQRACGKLSLWDAQPTQPPGGALVPKARWWAVYGLASVSLALLWAVTLLTYLLPPSTIWQGLFTAALTPNQARFIAVATTVFALEFTLARHLFCRFGCAVGFFQSLAWMANPRGLVMAFDRPRARECKTCDAPRGSACEAVCPMRLKPRNIKRLMFSCVQCGRCLQACAQSHAAHKRSPSLTWTVGADALRETLRQRQLEKAGRP
ncbi:MAG: quinol dehydrogenase ferredoxin subunit NapH [Rhodoferax sp.]